MLLKKRSRQSIRMMVEILESRVLLSTTFSIASFTGVPGQDNGLPRPSSLITDKDGNIFGTSQEGGPLNYGTIFEIPAGTNNVLTLASFTNATGVLPKGSLVLDANGDLFGAASGGGTANRGTLWELQKGDSTITTLWNFTGGNGGAYPGAGIVADAAGNLWGTTFGNDVQFGTVFEFTPPSVSASATGIMQTLAVLPKDAHLNSTLAVGTDGTLVKNGGFVYGTLYTVDGNSSGEIFQVGIRPRSGTTPGNIGVFTILGNFNTGTNDASLPVGTLLFLTSKTGKQELVGITTAGGSNNTGALYQATLPVGKTPMQITDLASFTNTNAVGRNPVGTLLVASTGAGSYVITGVTAFGGQNGNGGVFRTNLRTTNANGTFTADSVAQLDFATTKLTDQTGRNPTGGVAIGQNGDIYLTTANEGLLQNGSIVQLSTSAPGPDQLTFSGVPGGGTAGQALGTITVRAMANGSVDTSANGPITLQVTTGPATMTTDANGTPIVVNPLTVTSTLVNGIATFSNVTITQAGKITLRATDARRDSTSQSNQFTIQPAAVSKLVFLTQPTGANASRTWGQIQVAAEDQFGNIATNTSSKITITTTSNTPLSNATANTIQGIATFNNISTSTIGTYTLQASDGTRTVNSPRKVPVLATPSAMAFASVPAKAIVGSSFVIQVNVNHQGNVPITLSLASKPGGSNLFGTLTVMAVNGVATFSDLMLFTSGVYTFKATSPNLGMITSIKLNLQTVAQANKV